MKGKNVSTRFYNIPFEIQSFNDMPYRHLGNSGLKVSDVGLGTWKMGYPHTGDGSRIDEKSSMQIFDRALELGVTFWDTANRYNNASGNSERLIGSWFKDNPDQRRNIVLATKLSGGMDGLTPNHCGLSRTNIMESVYSSLERLQTDHIDLLYFHSFDPLTPPDESLLAIEDLVKQDLVRYFAVSNFTADQLKLYQSVESKLSSRVRIVALQNQFDILNGEGKGFEGALEYAERSDISFIAWSPMARGLLTNRYLDPSTAGPGDRLFDEGLLQERTGKETIKKLQSLSKIAAELTIELNQLVIAYMLSIPGMGPVIPTSSNIKQLESNAAAGNISLSDEHKKLVAELIS
ncbi:aldo/keto reductase [Daejeonella lutea]|uniref:Predicted oxidoreductase n=1 Tax=Daejeonella lutea TaxID=572036 RepID=A0A1T5AA35_9SPHI|nr:aldo/keto reductase [Daejeonella lutea]SKB31874.1 Predicted oxidoreductase [Daejeonella lutea]